MGYRIVRVLSVVGARPQFVKLAAIDRALHSSGNEHVVVHTGQHYDRLLSDAFFADLEISEPDVNLGVGAGTHAEQTAAALIGLEPALLKYRPDWVLVYGDTNATLAGALAAVKLGLPVAHLEAGLRSRNRAMAEEHNRVVADHTADLLLAPTEAAMQNLADEDLGDRAALVGDVMVDVLVRVRELVEQNRREYLPKFAENGRYLLATIHRAENTDDRDRLAAVLAGLGRCRMPVRLLAHPRLVARARAFDLPLAVGAIVPVEPLPYPAMVAALLGSDGLVTDSGGLQKEAFLLGVPCTTVRSETEWPETLVDDRNVLVEPEAVATAAGRLRPEDQGEKATSPYGDGRAAIRVVAEMAARISPRELAGTEQGT